MDIKDIDSRHKRDLGKVFEVGDGTERVKEMLFILKRKDYASGREISCSQKPTVIVELIKICQEDKE